MSPFLRNTTRLASAAGFVLLAGCAQMYPAPAPPPAVAYNPPGTALAALPANDVTRYHVNFATGSYRIDADGHAAIDNAAATMQGNAALSATIIGSTDTVGSDASNMRLSKQRATAVHDALLHTGKVAEARIETRWTGERRADAGQPGSDAGGSSRSVEIAVH